MVAPSRTAPANARLILELDLASDPLSGVVRDADGEARAFCGWMALTRAIELGLDAARRTSDEQPATSTD